MSRSLKRLASTLYAGCRPLAESNTSFPYIDDRFRFFAYGRHALYEALRMANVGEGDVVLLPEYICRETLAAAHALGTGIAYYPVDRALRMAVRPDALPAARAIVAVNYFGFPQDLEPFEAYCGKNGAVLIEDNAHGFLSRDYQGRYLGTRGDLGVFSFRKSLPIVNGSGLALNRPERVSSPQAQLPFRDDPEPKLFRVKKVLRRLADWHLTWLLYRLIELERSRRVVRSEGAVSEEDPEWHMPEDPAPAGQLPGLLNRVDTACEDSRRRALFNGLSPLIRELGGEPLFSSLPEHVVPYGLPFYASPDCFARIQSALKRNYLDAFPWPELPSDIRNHARKFYRSIYLVNFIW